MLDAPRQRQLLFHPLLVEKLLVQLRIFECQGHVAGESQEEFIVIPTEGAALFIEQFQGGNDLVLLVVDGKT